MKSCGGSRASSLTIHNYRLVNFLDPEGMLGCNAKGRRMSLRSSPLCSARG
jgi:hypothetical protein